MNFAQQLAEQINIGIDKKDIALAITATTDSAKGDFALPVFRFAKQLQTNPIELAKQIAQNVGTNKLICEAVAVGGYVNFFLNKASAVFAVCNEITSNANYGASKVGNGKTICIDYSSINIAKPFHIGHLGTTAIGNSLYKVYNYLGYKVVGINHLGDWGTQFGKMIVAFKKWGNKQMVQEGGLKALQAIYVRFHVEAETDSLLDEQARAWFVRIEKGDKEAMELFEYFKSVTLAEIKQIYAKLNVDFDSWNGESFYNDKMDSALEFLRSRNIVTESDGAQIVDLSSYNMPPCILVKKDGASLYATRDMAAILYRKAHYNFDKCLYVVAYQQNLYFKQLFKVCELAGLPYYSDLVHVAYGMVSLEDGAMSTRKGNTVWLSDVIDKAVAKAYDTICAKNPDLPNKEQIAEQVGCGAVMFSALTNARIKDIVFDFDRVLSFEGETCPYLQYTHARCCSIEQKAGASANAKVIPDYTACDNDESMALIKLLNQFPQIVQDVADKYEPSLLSNYLLSVAKVFNKLYFEHKILQEDTAKQNALLQLVACTKKVLNIGLGLLGISAPNKM